MRSRVNRMISATQRMAYTRRSNGQAFHRRYQVDRFEVGAVHRTALAIEVNRRYQGCDSIAATWMLTRPDAKPR